MPFISSFPGSCQETRSRRIASLLIAVESLRTEAVFTMDRQDFVTDRIRRGHRPLQVAILS